MDAPKWSYPVDLEYTLERPAFSTFLPVFDTVDTDGVPVMQCRSKLYPPAEAELITCPYEDSRRGSVRSMSRTALRRFFRNDAAVRDTFSTFMTVTRDFLGIPSHQPLTAEGLEFAAHAIYRFPHFLALNDFLNCRESTISGPVAIASAIAEGLSGLCLRIIHQGIEIDNSRIGTQLYDLADDMDGLIGPNEVCAASPRLIADFLECTIAKPKDVQNEHVSPTEIDRFRESVRFSVLAKLASDTAILFELARCLLWKHYSDVSDNHADKSVRHGPPRYAFAACARVHEISQVDFPEADRLVKSAAFPRENTVQNNELQSAFEEVRRGYEERIKMIKDGSLEQRDWRHFERTCLTLFNLVGKELSKSLSFRHQMQECSHKDLYIFFGDNPPCFRI